MAKWPRFDPDADRRLAKALSEGGEESLAALYDIYAERLRDYCGSLVHDQRVATDIVHDTLIDAHRRVRRMRDRTRLRAWLYAAVRRRCLQRVRHPELRLASGGASLNDEIRGLLETAFDRLDFLDQESLLLALRHDLTGDDLGALLGIPARRANARIARARLRAEGALDKGRRALAQRCAAADGDGDGDAAPGSSEADARHAELGAAEPDGADGPEAATEAAAPPSTQPPSTQPSSTQPPSTQPSSTRPPSTQPSSTRQPTAGRSSFGDGELADHMARCTGCRQRTELSLAGLLDRMPASALPSSLRHRVIHTGTDPELAGYRADIAARGGTLNTDGFPRQPDIPSHFARRWLFTSGGMVGAAVTAVAAAFLIGPGGPVPGLIWPSYRPEPSITPLEPARRPPEAQPPPPVRQPPAGGLPSDAAAQGGGPGSPRPVTPVPAGLLAVTPVAIDFGRTDRTAQLNLAVSRGPVTWRASTSTDRIALSADSGKISPDDEAVVKITFYRGLVELPGKATITIFDSAGRRHLINVVWTGSLL
jgi:RNA polymerase sigma factor (sigma-70 family)